MANRKKTPRKATVKKATVKKATVKKATAKKATPKKATPKKVKKATVKKATPKKATPKKATPKKATPKKATPKKPVDLAPLERALVRAARDAFAEVRAAHPGERFYTYVLYTEPLLGYVVPSCNSEEALARNGDEETRWCPCDWEYHCEGEDHFDEPMRHLDAAWSTVDDDDDDAHEALRERVWTVFHGALRELDAEGFFESGAERERVVLNVLWGDQDLKVHCQSAEELNPRAAYLAFARENLDGLRSNAAEFGGQARATLKRILADLGER